MAEPLYIVPEYGDGDGDQPYEIECPQCYATAWRVWDNQTGECRMCGTEVSFADDQDT